MSSRTREPVVRPLEWFELRRFVSEVNTPVFDKGPFWSGVTADNIHAAFVRTHELFTALRRWLDSIDAVIECWGLTLPHKAAAPNPTDSVFKAAVATSDELGREVSRLAVLEPKVNLCLAAAAAPLGPAKIRLPSFVPATQRDPESTEVEGVEFGSAHVAIHAYALYFRQCIAPLFPLDGKNASPRRVVAILRHLPDCRRLETLLAQPGSDDWFDFGIDATLEEPRARLVHEFTLTEQWLQSRSGVNSLGGDGITEFSKYLPIGQWEKVLGCDRKTIKSRWQSGQLRGQQLTGTHQWRFAVIDLISLGADLKGLTPDNSG